MSDIKLTATVNAPRVNVCTVFKARETAVSEAAQGTEVPRPEKVTQSLVTMVVAITMDDENRTISPATLNSMKFLEISFFNFFKLNSYTSF